MATNQQHTIDGGMVEQNAQAAAPSQASYGANIEQPFPRGDPSVGYQSETSATGGIPSPVEGRGGFGDFTQTGNTGTTTGTTVCLPLLCFKSYTLASMASLIHAQTNTRSKGDILKESASGAKGLVAAIHGAGEAIRGNFNAGVDRAFNEVCIPPEPLFPHLGALKDFECDEDKVGRVWLPKPLTPSATSLPPSSAS